MTKLNQIDQTGKKLQDLQVSDALFAAKVSPALMAQAVRIYQDRQHQHTSKVKTRGEVSLTTAKWFRQKGTGRARHGAQSAHIFVGGGVAHGPDGLRPAGKKLNLKMRRLSLIGALTSKAGANQVTIISGLDQVTPKTNSLTTLLKALKLNSNVLLFTAKPYPGLLKASANLSSLRSTFYKQAHLLTVLTAKHLLIDKEALTDLETWLTRSAGSRRAGKAPKAISTKGELASGQKVAVKKTATKKAAVKAAPKTKATKTTKKTNK